MVTVVAGVGDVKGFVDGYTNLNCPHYGGHDRVSAFGEAMVCAASPKLRRWAGFSLVGAEVRSFALWAFHSLSLRFNSGGNLKYTNSGKRSRFSPPLQGLPVLHRTTESRISLRG